MVASACPLTSKSSNSLTEARLGCHALKVDQQESGDSACGTAKDLD